MIKAIVIALLVSLQAASPPPQLTPEEEARAVALMREIRCVACENEPISQSAAEIAGDMRLRVQVLIAEGASDAEVRDWFAGRYGEFVLFRPPSKGLSGWLLWGGPFLLLAAGAGLALTLASRRIREDEPVDTVAPEDA